MGNRLFNIVLVLVSTLAPAAWAEDFTAYSNDELPTTSIYQLMYRPQVREGIPSSSIYSQIYDDGSDGDFSRNDQLMPTTLENRTNVNEFATSFATDFSIKKDFFDNADYSSAREEKAERADRTSNYCPYGYFSERLDTETFTMVRTCVSMANGENDSASGNAFLGNSTDKGLKSFADANNFVGAMAAESRRNDRQRIAAAMAAAGGPAQKMGMMLNDQMLGMLEQFAAGSPGLRDVLEEAMATGNTHIIYQRIQEAGGLESLMSNVQLAIDPGQKIESEQVQEIEDINPAFYFSP